MAAATNIEPATNSVMPHATMALCAHGGRHSQTIAVENSTHRSLAVGVGSMAVCRL